MFYLLFDLNMNFNKKQLIEKTEMGVEMENENFSAESAREINYEQKTICCLVVDVSASMADKPIQALNQGLQDFYGDISEKSASANRIEVAIVRFSNVVEVVLQPVLVAEFSMPTLSAGGSTAMVDGVREAMRVVENRKKWYRSTAQPYLRPWIILISDGQPDKDQDIEALAIEIEKATKEKHFIFLPIGVQGADMQVLTKISGFIQDTDEARTWIRLSPMKLDELRFHDFFKWVSASMHQYSASQRGDNLNLPKPTWMTGFTV
jgi:uncharacterized protein YegL